MYCQGWLKLMEVIGNDEEVLKCSIAGASTMPPILVISKRKVMNATERVLLSIWWKCRAAIAEHGDYIRAGHFVVAVQSRGIFPYCR